jgi:hypothetical protein
MVQGAVRAWRLMHLPASGQISNVSAFVLPEPMPVVDDDRQLPMFAGDDPREALLFLRVIERQAEVLGVMAAIVAAAQERDTHEARKPQRDGRLQPVSEPKPKPKRRHQPQDQEFRTWKGFREAMQRLEDYVRRDKQLKPEEQVTPEMLNDDGGSPSPRTMKRILAETYGLPSDLWPPSTWPKDLPAEPDGQI